MKKIIYLLAFFVLKNLTAFAQETKFGVRAGVNLAKFAITGSDANGINELTDAKSLVNFSFTGYADIPFNENFSIQPGVDLQGKGTKLAAANTDNEGNAESNLMYVGIPVNLVGKLPVSFGKVFLGAGPYFGYAISGKNKTDDGNGQKTSEKVEFGNTANDDLNPLDFGANFIGGVELSSGFTIHAGYGLGLSNLVPKDRREGNNAKVSNRVINFGVGFIF